MSGSIIKISNKDKAAFLNKINADGVMIPSKYISIINDKDPFTIEVSNNVILGRVQNILENSKIKYQILNPIKEFIKKNLKELGFPKFIS